MLDRVQPALKRGIGQPRFQPCERIFQAAQTFFRLGRAPLVLRLIGVALAGGLVGFLQGPVEGVGVALYGPFAGGQALLRCLELLLELLQALMAERDGFFGGGNPLVGDFGPRHKQLVIVRGLGLHMPHPGG
jgi:hypothetical protein